MNQNENTNSGDESVLSESNSTIIDSILEKHSLNKNPDIDELIKLPDDSFFNLIDNLPGSKIAGIIKEILKGNLSLENLPQEIERQLVIPKKKAVDISKELISNFFQKNIKINNLILSENKLSKPTLALDSDHKNETEEIKKISNGDAYREQID